MKQYYHEKKLVAFQKNLSNMQPTEDAIIEKYIFVHLQVFQFSINDIP